MLKNFPGTRQMVLHEKKKKKKKKGIPLFIQSQVLALACLEDIYLKTVHICNLYKVFNLISQQRNIWSP